MLEVLWCVAYAGIEVNPTVSVDRCGADALGTAQHTADKRTFLDIELAALGELRRSPTGAIDENE